MKERQESPTPKKPQYKKKVEKGGEKLLDGT